MKTFVPYQLDAPFEVKPTFTSKNGQDLLFESETIFSITTTLFSPIASEVDFSKASLAQAWNVSMQSPGERLA